MKKELTKKQELERAICKNHTAKMEGFWSLSTAMTCNKHCQSRAAMDAVKIELANGETVEAMPICVKCYAAAMLKRYGALNAKLEHNAALLAVDYLNDDDIPFINAAFFRFEAFGDIINEIHVFNLFKIAECNPHCTFTLWTKNPFIIRHAIQDGAVKPDNLIVILSSLYVNINAAVDSKYTYIDSFVDKVFTVYDKAHAANVNINCGGRKCAECRRCYNKRNADAMTVAVNAQEPISGEYIAKTIEIVNELLK